MKSLQLLFITFLFLAVVGRGVLSFLYAPKLHEGQYVRFETVLLTEPASHGNFDTITVQYTNGFSTVPLSLAFPSGNGLHYGQDIVISGRVKFKKLNAASSQNRQVPANTKIITTISSLHIKIQPGKQNWLLGASFFLRQQIQSLYTRTLSQRWAALLLGIVLGIKVQFPKDFLNELQKTGVVHVIAAEGLNVIIVSQFLLGIFSSFLKRQWAVMVTLGCLFFYALVCGLQPSIVRATIMMGFALSAQLVGRQYNSVYGLMLAAAAMVLYNPVYIFDVGFQLSFGATMGIIFFKPMLPKWGILSEDINTTIAAQVTTLPVLLGTFGSYGLVSVVANAAILWTIPILMILGGVGGLVGIFFPSLGQFLIFLCYPFLFFFDKVITFFASFPWQVSLTFVPVSITIGYYLLLISVVLFVKERKKKETEQNKFSNRA